MRKAKLQTKKLLEQGGMLQEGGTIDKESGNKVPVGAMKEEVRDDIPAKLSEGEFVFPADVVRYIGLERLMMMRQAAKEGLKKMEEMGQMSNAEEATMEDDAEFESKIDDILKEIEGEKEEEGGEEEEEGGEKEAEMAVGGIAMPPMGQDQQQVPPAPMPMDAKQLPQPTEEDMAIIKRTTDTLKQSESDIAALPPSNPTEGLKSTDIIKSNFGPDKQKEADEFITKIERLIRANRVISLRHNDTVIIGFVKKPGVLDPFFFSSDTPEKLNEAITTGIEVAKKAGIKTLESDNKGNIEPLVQLGYDVQETKKGWKLDIQ